MANEIYQNGVWYNRDGSKCALLNNPGQMISIAQSAVPVILVPSGTVTVGGALTIVTDLTQNPGPAWVYLPMNAVANSPAGLYYTVFNSKGSATVYTDFGDTSMPFVPYIPENPTVAVGSGVAYTQILNAEISLFNIPLPKEMIGRDGYYRCVTLGGNNNSANTKTYSLRVGNTEVAGRGRTATLAEGWLVILRNKGSYTKQLSSANNYLVEPNSNGTASYSYYNLNLGIDQTLYYNVKLAIATDWVMLEGFDVEAVCVDNRLQNQ